MNDDRLNIYINDHLALMVAEMELVDRCYRSNKEDALGRFLEQLGDDLRIERDVVKEVLRLTGGEECLAKQALAWLAEKVGRFKLNDAVLQYSDLSRLVEVETLNVAAEERRSLWENLQTTRGDDPRLSHIPFENQLSQAQQHCEALTFHRLQAAKKAL